MRGHSPAGKRDLLLVRHLLAIDGLLLRLTDVDPLERTLLLQRTAGQLLTLRVLGDESQVYASDQILETGIERRLDGALSSLAITLDASCRAKSTLFTNIWATRKWP